MSPTVHEIDPEGDVLLVLETPNLPFAIWRDDDVWPDPMQPSPKHNWTYKPSMFQVLSHDEYSGPVTNIEICDYAVEEPAVEEPAVEEPTAEELVADKLAAAAVENVHFWLSSRHLILASSYFKRLLKGRWSENIVKTNVEANVAQVTATDWDEEALLILMNIIHGRCRRVPRTVSLEMLAKIAALVNYYECPEVVEAYTGRWISHALPKIPTVYNRELVLSILITSVFGKAEKLKEATKVMIPLVKGPISKMDLPIPDSIIDGIEKIRQETVGKIFAFLHDLLHYLRDEQTRHPDCSSLLLGSLERHMQSCHILSKPADPCYGYSISKLTSTIRDFQSPSTLSLKHNKKSYNGVYCDSSYKKCSLGMFIDPFLDALVGGIKGLSIKE